MSDIEDLAHLVNEMVDGWYERIEYNVVVNRRTEKRVRAVRQRGLVDQLIGEVTGYSPVSLGARYGQPGSRPPGTLDLMDLVDVINRYVKDMEGRTLKARLRALVSAAAIADDDWVSQTCRELRRFRKTARIMLQYDVPKRALRDTVCGSCGGPLVVALDACSDVCCVAPQCGTVYRKYQWVDLLGDA